MPRISHGELAQMEQAAKNRADNSDRCVLCGEYVPEGRMVCTQCEKNEYKSPVSVMISDIATKLEKTQDGIIIKAIQDVDVKVDKDALIKAIETDRKYQEGKLIEVVRCVNCKYLILRRNKTAKCCNGGGLRNIAYDSYCAYGERRKNND